MEEIEELDKKTMEADFYSDMETAGKVMQRIKGLKNKIERYEDLYREWEDLTVLVSLAIEGPPALQRIAWLPASFPPI